MNYLRGYLVVATCKKLCGKPHKFEDVAKHCFSLFGESIEKEYKIKVNNGFIRVRGRRNFDRVSHSDSIDSDYCSS